MAMRDAFWTALAILVVLAPGGAQADSWVALVGERGADVVMRLHHLRHFDFRRGRRLGADDHIVSWHKPSQRPDWMDEATYARLPATLTMRELRIRVPHKNGRSRTILVATTLLDVREYPKQAIAELYRQHPGGDIVAERVPWERGPGGGNEPPGRGTGRSHC
jgi:hypothetical protein